MQYTIPFSFVELEPNNYHIICKGKVNGVPVRLVIDTGASHTCFDVNFITSIMQDCELKENDGLNAAIGGSDFKSQLAVLSQFKLSRFEKKDYQVVLIDLSNINVAYKALKRPEIQGILGSDFLREYGAIIDYSACKLTIRKER